MIHTGADARPVNDGEACDGRQLNDTETCAISTMSTQKPLCLLPWVVITEKQQLDVLAWCAELVSVGDGHAADWMFRSYWQERRSGLSRHC